MQQTGEAQIYGFLVRRVTDVAELFSFIIIVG